MLKVVKILMLLWLVLCGGIGACSIVVGGAGASGALSEERTAYEVMAENPELSLEQAESMLALERSSEAAAGTIVAGFGAFGAFIMWFIGMIPLLVLYLIAKPSGTTVQVQQVVGSMPAQQTSRDAER